MKPTIFVKPLSRPTVDDRNSFTVFSTSFDSISVGSIVIQF